MRLNEQSRGRDHESSDEGGQTRKQHEVAQEHTHTRPLTFAAWPPSGIQKVDYGKRSGLEGIVSKRKDSAYRSGRSPDWLKMKNADAPAVKREAEENWGR
jgi:ATP-dependent DNA ligase